MILVPRPRFLIGAIELVWELFAAGASVQSGASAADILVGVLGEVRNWPLTKRRSGTVVRTLRSRTTLAKSIARISRATVQPAAAISSRASCRQTFGSP